jgi:hypothetical protein
VVPGRQVGRHESCVGAPALPALKVPPDPHEHAMRWSRTKSWHGSMHTFVVPSAPSGSSVAM